MSDENPEDKITREKSYIFFREKKTRDYQITNIGGKVWLLYDCYKIYGKA